MSTGFTKLIAAVAFIGAFSVAAGSALADCAEGVKHSVSAPMPVDQSSTPVTTAGTPSPKGG